MRLPELRVFSVVFFDRTTQGACLLYGMVVLFAWPRRAVIPEARRVAPQARGIDGESACQAIMRRAMDASRVLYPCQTRGSPVVVRIDFSVRQSSHRCEVRGAFDALDSRRSPCRSYATLAASTYIRSGSSPNQGPSCNIARAKGLQGRRDPSLGRHLAATPPGGHASTLDWYVPLVSPQDSCINQPFRTAPVGATPVSR